MNIESKRKKDEGLSGAPAGHSTCLKDHLQAATYLEQRVFINVPGQTLWPLTVNKRRILGNDTNGTCASMYRQSLLELL